MSNNHDQNNVNSKNILIAFSLNFSFSIIEFIGGAITNSVAIMSDAVHDLGDSISLILSYFAEKSSTKEANDLYPYGYRRYSILGAFLNAIILIAGSGYVIYEAAQRLLSPEPVDSEGMLYLAILGILVNSISAYIVSKGKSLNQKMVMYHLLEDLFGWICVLIVSIVTMFKPWYFLDSLLSILISIIILKGVIQNLIKVVNVILQKFPRDVDRDKLMKDLLDINSLEKVNSLKVWSLDGEHHYADLKISAEKDITDEIEKVLENHNIIDQTIQEQSRRSSL